MLLFEPFVIGKLKIKNRVGMAPMSLNLTQNGFVTDRMVRFFEERAKGGVGLITIGDGIVDSPLGKNVKQSTLIDDDKYIPQLKKLASAVKQHGAKVALQLSHGGRRAGRVSQKGYLEVTEGKIPVAPSPIPHPVPGQVVPRELKKEEIKEIVAKFGEASRRAIKAGFDAIGLHCAHMYLCGQFLSPWANQRTDEYGKNFEGRLKFVLEVINQIKIVAGDNFPLIVRMNGQEPEGGNSLEEIQEIARRFEKAGVDAIHVSVGFGAPTKTPGLIPSVSPMRASVGCIVHLSENIKRGISIPVIAVNKISNIFYAEQVLQKKMADLIAMGRPLIADPYLPAKALEGKVDEIRPCIYCCQGCLENVLEKNAPVACSINPMAGRETEISVTPAKKKKKVLVLGAGPSGMQATITAANRGHQVFLIDRADHMGGDLYLAAKISTKKSIEPFLTYLINQIKNADVQVELGKQITPEWLDRVQPDVAIVASGSQPIVPNIPGLSKVKFLTAAKIITGSEIKGKKIIVIGGGPMGCEIAEVLCESGKEVTIIEILDDVALGVDCINRLPLIMSLENYGVRFMTKSKVDSITDQGVCVDCLGETQLLTADGIVIAVGKKPCLEDIDDIIKEKVPEVYIVGDKVKSRGILNAVHDGFNVAITI